MAAEDGLVVCGVPAFMGISGQCGWDEHDLTYSVTSSLPGLADNLWLDALKLAWSFMEAVCDVRSSYTEDAMLAHLLVATGAIDGPSGVLAWSEMPCGNQDPEQLKQRYDSGERQWVVAENPVQGTLDIVRVAAHEIMHFLGVPHAPEGTQALIAPIYNTQIRRPQPYDIAELQARYGPPKLLPPPVAPPPVIPPPVVPPVTPTTPPTPGGPMTFLQLIQLILALLGQLNPGTPTVPPAPGAPAAGGGLLDFIRRLLAAFGAGKVSAAQLQAAYQTLSLHEVTEAQMAAPIQAMRLN